MVAAAAPGYRMKAAYEFLIGNSVVTPIGLAIAVGAAFLLVRAGSTYASLALIVLLLATLAFSVFERPS